jgi:hypothetical protein
MSAYVARSNRHLRTGLIGALLVAVSVEWQSRWPACE